MTDRSAIQVLVSEDRKLQPNTNSNSMELIRADILDIVKSCADEEECYWRVREYFEYIEEN